MTTIDLIALRKAMGVTQAEMAARLGLSARAYQDIEAAEGEVKARHLAMVERTALAAAVEQRNPMLAPASIRREALELARLLTS